MPAPVSVGSPGPGAGRPVDLPLVLPGGSCPVTTTTHAPDPAFGAVLGSGPAGPVGMKEGVLSYVGPTSPSWSDPWWGGQKVLWVVDPAVVGEVVVTGRQLDGPHEIAFNDPTVSRLVLAENGGAGTGSWRDYPGYTRLQAPGCYAFVVEAGGSTSVLVFRAEGPVVEPAHGCQGIVDALVDLLDHIDSWPPLDRTVTATAERVERSIATERGWLSPGQRQLVDRLAPFVNSLLLGDARTDAPGVLRRGRDSLRSSCPASPASRDRVWPPIGGHVLADAPVDSLPEQVRVSGVPAVLLEEIAQQPTQACLLPVGRRQVHQLLDATVGQSPL